MKLHMQTYHLKKEHMNKIHNMSVARVENVFEMSAK